MPDFLRQGLLSERINAMSPSGPSSFDKGYADSEAMEERLMDEASMSGGQSPDWESLPSSGPSVYQQNYSDPEAMEERLMNEASEQGGGVDWESLPSSGPELFQKKGDTSLDSFIKSSNRSNEERGIWDDVKEGASGLYDKAKGLLNSEEEGSNIQEITNPAFQRQNALTNAMNVMDEGSAGEAEGAAVAERRQQFQEMSKRLNLPGVSDKISTSEMTEDQKRMMGPEYKKNENVAAYLDEGESALDQIGGQNYLDTKYGHNEELGPDKMEKAGESIDQTSILDPVTDYVSGLFSSGGEDSAEDKAGKKQLGAALMKGASGGGSKPPGGGMAMPTSKTVRGQVAFPGLLNKQKRQKNPYFMPKGLV